MNMQEQQAYKLGQYKVISDLMSFVLLKDEASLLDFISNYEVIEYQQIIWPDG